MGIPKFASWLRRHRTLGKAVTKDFRENIDTLAIDLNGLIHPVVANVLENNPPSSNIEGLIADDVIKEIRRITSRFRPSQRLIIAVDGVAPCAKIKQQRERRFAGTSSLTEDGERVIFGDYTDANQITFDTNQISPGTPFMFVLDRKLREGMISPKCTPLGPIPSPGFPDIVIYSSHLDPGEGEHKIAKMLRDIEGKSSETPGNVLIHGADADLILISLLLLQGGPTSKGRIEDITIMREAREITEFIKIRDLAEVIRREIPTKYSLESFVAAMSLNGNDFLPHFPSFRVIDRTLNTILEALATFREDLCDSRGIIWANYSSFLLFFRDNYYERLLMMWADNIGEGRNGNAMRDLSPLQEMVQRDRAITAESRQRWYFRAHTSRETRSIRTLELSKRIVSPQDISRMIESYLQGIEWTFRYYFMGQDSISKKWYYPYHYPPLFPDVVSMAQQGSWDKLPPIAGPFFLSPLEQLAMILPKASRFIAPPELYPFYSNTSPLADLYPLSVKVQTRGMAVFYERIMFLPIPNPSRIQAAVEGLGLSDIDTSRYEETSPIILERPRSISRGRGSPSRGRGGPPSRGRGSPSRGRGSSSRGRGGSPSRGRGSSSRGRGGPPSRGRGGPPSRGRGGPPSRGRGGPPSRGRGGPPSRGRGGPPSRGRGGPPSRGRGGFF